MDSDVTRGLSTSVVLQCLQTQGPGNVQSWRLRCAMSVMRGKADFAVAEVDVRIPKPRDPQSRIENSVFAISAYFEAWAILCSK